MALQNILYENKYKLFCDTLTCNTVNSTIKPQEIEVPGLCICTTLPVANTPTAVNTVAQTGLSIFYTISNGICFVYKKGISGTFPDLAQPQDLKNNISGTNILYILARAPGSPDTAGGIFIPPNTFPICATTVNQRSYVGVCQFNFPLRQNSETPVGIDNNIVSFKLHTVNANSGQYFEIKIPRSYDYIQNGDAGITASVNTLQGDDGQGGTIESATKPLNNTPPNDITKVRYVQQNFSGANAGNSMPEFFIQYPIE